MSYLLLQNDPSQKNSTRMPHIYVFITSKNARHENENEKTVDYCIGLFSSGLQERNEC